MKERELLGVARILLCHILLVIISHYYTKLGSYLILIMDPHDNVMRMTRMRSRSKGECTPDFVAV
jgi:hypothetical protein